MSTVKIDEKNQDRPSTFNITIKNDRFRDFVSGLLAGFISVTVCNPLDITRTRLNIMVPSISYKSSPNHASNRYSGFLHALKVIWT